LGYSRGSKSGRGRIDHRHAHHAKGKGRYSCENAEGGEFSSR
jgi:hypothetical protein